MTDQPDDVRTDSRGRSAVSWLLVIPLLLVAYPPLYNRTDPTLFGIPFFYWYQLAVIGVSVVCTTVVYRAGRATGGSR
jgi:hypothetical protein